MGSETILKNKKCCRDQKQIFFYKDQNLNEAYLQGRVQYLSLSFKYIRLSSESRSGLSSPFISDFSRDFRHWCEGKLIPSFNFTKFVV